FILRFSIVKIASAPHSIGSDARHLAPPPPPHSSLNRILVPSLLNVAECQYEKFESATASRRTGASGLLMSSSRPWPSHAPPARPSDGYTVMSWHCRLDEIGEPGRGASPNISLTMPCRFVRSVALSAAV